MSPDALILAQNAPKMRLASMLHPDRWGSLQRSPRPRSWIQGVLLLGEGREERGPEGERQGDGRGGREGGMRPILYPDLGG